MTDNVMIHPTAIVEEGVTLGAGSKVWHFSHLMPGAHVGNNCSLGQNVVMMPGSSLGDGCKVQNNVSIYSGVHCQDRVFLGPSCVFTNVMNPRSFIERKDEYRSTIIELGASIGANATILCGINIGEYALIGAGAVVIRSVAPYALMVGNPARQIGWVSRAAHRLEFNHEGIATCPETNEKYLMHPDAQSIQLIEE